MNELNNQNRVQKNFIGKQKKRKNNKPKNNRNDFTKDENKNAAPFNLWLLFNDQGKAKYNREKYIFYSFYGKKVESVIRSFGKIVAKNKQFLALARMHNNQTKELLKSFDL